MVGDLMTTVLGVEQRTSRDGQRVMYDVSLGDGQKYTTFDEPMARKAAGFQGQQVQARVESKPNNNGGQYLNIKDVGAPGSLPALPQPLTSGATPMAGQVQPFGAPQAGPAVPFGQAPQVAPVAQQPFPQAAPSGGGRYSEQDIARMNRSAAAATAATLLAGAYEGAGDALPWGKLFSLSEAIVQYQYTGLNPLGAQPQPAGVTNTGAPQVAQPEVAIAPVAQDAAGVAAFANAEIPGAVQQGVPTVAAAGDGIPF